MSINTNFSATTGLPAAATIIKRRLASNEAPKAFMLDEDPVQQRAEQPSVQENLKEPLVTDSEKQYFAALFPSDAGAVRSYSPYQRNGSKQSVTVGTIVDVKG
jgi:hypothetical protein